MEVKKFKYDAVVAMEAVGAAVVAVVVWLPDWDWVVWLGLE